MTNEDKCRERLETIRQILEQSKMNPDFKEIDRIYKLTKDVSNENN